jgi:capsular polysaccharide biosynthesis protein
MDKEIKVKDLFLTMKKHFWLMILITLTSTGLSGFYGIYHTTPIYQSSTEVLMPLDKPEYQKTLEDILKNPIVLDLVGQRLGLNQSPEALSGQVNFISQDGSDVGKIIVQDPNPLQAAKIANTIANVFLQQMGNILGIYNSKILSEAKPSQKPIPINQSKKFAIGFAGGFVISLGLIFLMDSMNDSLTTEYEIENLLGLPVLGAVSKMNAKNSRAKQKKQMTTVKGGTIRA